MHEDRAHCGWRDRYRRRSLLTGVGVAHFSSCMVGAAALGGIAAAVAATMCVRTAGLAVSTGIFSMGVGYCLASHEFLPIWEKSGHRGWCAKAQDLRKCAVRLTVWPLFGPKCHGAVRRKPVWLSQKAALAENVKVTIWRGRLARGGICCAKKVLLADVTHEIHEVREVRVEAALQLLVRNPEGGGQLVYQKSSLLPGPKGASESRKLPVSAGQRVPPEGSVFSAADRVVWRGVQAGRGAPARAAAGLALSRSCHSRRSGLLSRSPAPAKHGRDHPDQE